MTRAAGSCLQNAVWKDIWQFVSHALELLEIGPFASRDLDEFFDWLRRLAFLQDMKQGFKKHCLLISQYHQKLEIGPIARDGTYNNNVCVIIGIN